MGGGAEALRESEGDRANAEGGCRPIDRTPEVAGHRGTDGGANVACQQHVGEESL
jgi:hypothetical protein